MEKTLIYVDKKYILAALVSKKLFIRKGQSLWAVKKLYQAEINSKKSVYEFIKKNGLLNKKVICFVGHDNHDDVILEIERSKRLAPSLNKRRAKSEKKEGYITREHVSYYGKMQKITKLHINKIILSGWMSMFAGVDVEYMAPMIISGHSAKVTQNGTAYMVSIKLGQHYMLIVDDNNNVLYERVTTIKRGHWLAMEITRSIAYYNQSQNAKKVEGVILAGEEINKEDTQEVHNAGLSIINNYSPKIKIPNVGRPALFYPLLEALYEKTVPAILEFDFFDQKQSFIKQLRIAAVVFAVLLVVINICAFYFVSGLEKEIVELQHRKNQVMSLNDEINRTKSLHEYFGKVKQVLELPELPVLSLAVLNDVPESIVLREINYNAQTNEIDIKGGIHGDKWEVSLDKQKSWIAENLSVLGQTTVLSNSVKADYLEFLFTIKRR